SVRRGGEGRVGPGPGLPRRDGRGLLDATACPCYCDGMAIDLTHPLPSAIDVSGLSPDEVRAVESFVAHLRSAGRHPPTAPRPTDAEFDRALKDLASGPAVPTLPADRSRADLYGDHD